MQDFQIIIGDDNSLDGSRSIIARYCDQRMLTHFAHKNIGLFGHLNILLRYVKAPLVHILCQDDVLQKECLENECNFFAAHNDVGLIFCKGTTIDTRGRKILESPLEDMPEVLTSRLSSQLLFYQGCIAGNLSTVCIPLKSIERYGYFNEEYRLAGDYEMWSRISLKSNIGVLHRHRVYVRSHPAQLSKTRHAHIRFLSERNKVFSILLSSMPARIRRRCIIYKRFKHDIMDMHCALIRLLHGDVIDFVQYMNMIGLYGFIVTLILWVCTMNNMLYKPQCRYIYK